MRVATFDLETDGLLDSCKQVWCGVIKDHDTETRISYSSFGAPIGPFDEHFPDSPCRFEHYIKKFIRALETYDVLIGHNSIAFDFPILRKLFNWEYKGIKVDTLLMSRLQRPNRTSYLMSPHSVEAWGHRLGRKKIEHDEWDKFSPEMLRRCGEDVEIQHLIYNALLEEGKGEGWSNAHKLNHKLFALLQRQEEYGWTVDKDHLLNCIDKLTYWIIRIDRAVDSSLPLILDIQEVKKNGEYGYVKKPFKKDGSYSLSTNKFLSSINSDNRYIGSDVVGPFSRIKYRTVNLDSNIECKNFLLSLGWEPVEWNTNNVGKNTTPKLSKYDPFEGIKGGLGKLITKRVQCKQRKGILEGWKSHIREDGRIPPVVKGHAATGRIRHSIIVNVPSNDVFFGKWMRKIFIARPGWKIVGADSKGNQIRMLAARMDDEEFTKAVLYGTKEKGTDLHSLNSKRASLGSRTKAKNFFYGYIFGAGDPKIGKIIGGSRADGKRFREQFLDEIPKLAKVVYKLTQEWKTTAKQRWNKKWNRMEYRDGYIIGLDGRRIYIDSEHKVLVYTLQSDEAIHMASAYCVFYKRMADAGYRIGKDYGPLIWMHDEIQVEARPELAKEIGEALCEAIKWAGEYYRISVPHGGEYLIGDNWYETH